ncbi:MAG TPA: NADH:flavin oxidoreductase/NADH oxidase [Casimicrobiaceae bacterium]|nr:NADH:flavin oxidoreductase/NADH oxidase [Casimicrobiaceae bacterium]
MALFDPFSLRGLELANRIVVSPMCQYSADDGCAGDWHLAHWAQMLQSGASLLFVEATAVTRDGRITHGCLGLYDDACERAFADVLARARRLAPSVPVALQLAHAGRKASSALPWEGGAPLAGPRAWPACAPSAVAFDAGHPVPRAIDGAGLASIRDAFAAAARRAARAGVDAIEVHLAHGYLLHEFLSPLANQRQDAYGGTRERRLRFPLEVFEAVREAFPADRPVGARVSATDWVPGGWTLDDTIALAGELAARGADFIDVSSAGLSPAQRIESKPGLHVPFARAIRAATRMPTIVVGLITEPAQADAIVASGDADLVALARGLLWNPRWPWHAAQALGAKVAVPPQYLRAVPRR